MAHIMSKRGSADNVVTYEHYCDTINDLNNIAYEYSTLGSVAIVVQGASGELEVYIANGEHQWILLSTASSSGGGSEADETDSLLKDYKFIKIHPIEEDGYDIGIEYPLVEPVSGEEISSWRQQGKRPVLVGLYDDSHGYIISSYYNSSVNQTGTQYLLTFDQLIFSPSELYGGIIKQKWTIIDTANGLNGSTAVLSDHITYTADTAV